MNEKKVITGQNVRHVASLARIHLDENEVIDLTTELETILEYIVKLQNLDVANVKPTSHAFQLENVYREDKVIAHLTQDEALSIAIEKKNGYFKVPKVIE